MNVVNLSHEVCASFSKILKASLKDKVFRYFENQNTMLKHLEYQIAGTISALNSLTFSMFTP